MKNSIRLAIAGSAALAILGLAPANADPADAVATLPVTKANLPKVPVPNLLGDEAEPQLTAPVAPTPDEMQSAQPVQDDDSDDALVKGGNLADTVAALSGPEAGSHELDCLATGIYFESKSEPLNGQLAVGKVIANRSTSGRFPASYCGVLFQRGQFSFIRGHSLPSVPRASKQWRTAVAMAKIVDRKLHDSLVGNALFFHAKRVSPGWHLKRIAAIGNHIFYR